MHAYGMGSQFFLFGQGQQNEKGERRIEQNSLTFYPVELKK